MNAEESNAFIMTGVWILIGSCFISIMVWFIAIVINTTEREKMKHDTCMVITDTYLKDNAPATIVTAYCGEKSNG